MVSFSRMKTSLEDIEAALMEQLNKQIPPLRSKNSSQGGMTFEGTKPGMQGKQKVDGYYFASVVPKPKDVRLYFFPIYTHADQFQLSADLQKALKGKSCFHIKKLSPELEEEIGAMIEHGKKLYLADGLI